MSLHKDPKSSSLHQEYEEDEEIFEVEESPRDINHKREVKRLLDEHLERKRLKKELEDELDEDFDWSQLNKPS